jgi:phage virion morphogenesis protein
MSNDIHALNEWLDSFLNNLNDTQRRRLAITIGKTLRESQKSRILAQKNPDGSSFVARKAPSNRYKKGKIKKGIMFKKIVRNSSFKINASADGVKVGFYGKNARLAEVHQYGLVDYVRKNGPRIRYPVRQLLGINDGDIELIKSAVIKHFNLV